jgi:hypothetical protein
VCVSFSLFKNHFRLRLSFIILFRLILSFITFNTHNKRSMVGVMLVNVEGDFPPIFSSRFHSVLGWILNGARAIFYIVSY